MRWMDAGQPARRAVLLSCAGAMAGLAAAGCGTATATTGAPSKPVPGLAVPHSAIRRLTALVQFAFFGAGRHAGTVDFTHPILAGYLAARYALILLRRGAAS